MMRDRAEQLEAVLSKENEHDKLLYTRCIVEEPIASFIYKHRVRRWRLTRLSILVGGTLVAPSGSRADEKYERSYGYFTIVHASDIHHPLSVHGAGQSRYLVSLLENLAQNNICRSIRRIGG
jgi:hypothetical protein